MRTAVAICALVWALGGLVLFGSMFVPGGGVLVICKSYTNADICRVTVGRDRDRAQELRERYEEHRDRRP